MDCLFCRIIAGQEAAVRVYADEHCLAFMDIHPLGKGHLLLIPALHVEQLEALSDEVRAHLYRVYDRLLAAQRKAGMGVKGSHLLVNDGRAANQHVPHAHLHLIPREPGDSLGFGLRMFLHLTGLFGPRTRQATLEAQAQRIRQHL
jgi:histidine triad (HIT) family protein